MRPLSLIFSTTLLVLAASAGAQSQSRAQAQTYPRPDTAPISTVTVTAPAKTIRLRDEQVREIAGTYAMANGWNLRVRGTPHYIDATIDDQQPLRLRPVSADKFVSGDGNVTMEFNRGASREDMLMSYVPDPNNPGRVEVSAQRERR